MHSLSAFHSLSDKCMSSVQHHSLGESQFWLTFWFKIHSEVVELVQLISILLNGISLRRGLFENVFLRIEKDVEIGEMESLIKHLLNLFLSFGREFATINIFSFFGVVIDFGTTLICVALTLTLWSYIVF